MCVRSCKWIDQAIGGFRVAVPGAQGVARSADLSARVLDIDGQSPRRHRDPHRRRVAQPARGLFMRVPAWCSTTATISTARSTRGGCGISAASDSRMCCFRSLGSRKRCRQGRSGAGLCAVCGSREGWWPEMNGTFSGWRMDSIDTFPSSNGPHGGPDAATRRRSIARWWPGETGVRRRCGRWRRSRRGRRSAAPQPGRSSAPVGVRRSGAQRSRSSRRIRPDRP